MGSVQKSYLIPASQTELFAYLSDLAHLPEQFADRLEIEFPDAPPQMGIDETFSLQMTRYNVAAKIVCRVEQFQSPERLVYRQLKGIFKKWNHTILLEPHDQSQTRMTDLVEFSLPFGLLGLLADDLIVRAEVSRLLKFRSEKIAEYFRKHPHSGKQDS